VSSKARASPPRTAQAAKARSNGTVGFALSLLGSLVRSPQSRNQWWLSPQPVALSVGRSPTENERPPSPWTPLPRPQRLRLSALLDVAGVLKPATGAALRVRLAGWPIRPTRERGRADLMPGCGSSSPSTRSTSSTTRQPTTRSPKARGGGLCSWSTSNWAKTRALASLSLQRHRPPRAQVEPLRNATKQGCDRGRFEDLERDQAAMAGERAWPGAGPTVVSSPMIANARGSLPLRPAGETIAPDQGSRP
jgi:hypothetical protein